MKLFFIIALDTLKISNRCRLSPLARQCRETLAALTPSLAVILRVLQWVTASGLSCVVNSTSCTTSIFTCDASHGWLRSMPTSPDSA